MTTIYTLLISLTAIIFFWFGVNYLAGRKQMKSARTKVKFINECQAPVISLADGRKLNNVKSGS